ncbi:MAG: methyltransferase domain-containing protein [Verrucomicrobia bacterium]|nr:methyltransferase domain-containing protein [Verrucomicrobiota bacterium]MBU6447039.1 methyltransferase domain-containing protein [Verrucomicrobiota bacterium]MDE3047981.1 class I SAM-dependent methyltransferase [Verrucomicrobiota bacterium]
MNSEKQLKDHTIQQWNTTPCGSANVEPLLEPGSLEFFDAFRKIQYESTDPWMKELIPFALGKDKKVLEIGFGMGTDLLTWRLEGAEVYGIDLTPEHYRLATLNFKTHNQPAHLQIADAAHIPFPSESFDICYSHGVLHHTPDTVRCISEAYRVLKPGGQLIFSMYRTYSAFHLVAKLLVEGVCQGKLKQLGYRGLLATLEKGADGIHIKPLVKTYTIRALQRMLSDFSQVRFKVGHFKREHLSKFGWLCPKFLEKPLERWLGWYLVAYATK